MPYLNAIMTNLFFKQTMTNLFFKLKQNATFISSSRFDYAIIISVYDLIDSNNRLYKCPHKTSLFYTKHGKNGRYFSTGLSRHYTSINSNFNNPIPSQYIFGKNKPFGIFFKIWELYFNNFLNAISKIIPCDFVYTVFIRVRYNKNEYFIAGNQFAFNYSSKLEVKGMLDIVMSRLDQYLDDYNLNSYDISYIQLAFRQKDHKLLSEFSVQKDKPLHISDIDNNLINYSLNIPVSVNEDSIGKPLTVTVTNGTISHIYL